VNIEILPEGAAISSLVFKLGSNVELVDSANKRYLLDLGSEEARLARHLGGGWHLAAQDIQSSYATFDFAHTSGFQAQLRLSWSESFVEARADIKAPGTVVINSNRAPGGTTTDGSDRWAAPGATDVVT